MIRNQQSGQALVAVAIGMVFLAGFAGLAIDMGTLRFQRRLEQSAADAAALAAASEATYSGYSTAAQTAATQNGFPDGGTAAISACDGAAVGTTCVEIHNPPQDVTFNGSTIPGGPHAGDAAYYEALVAKVQPTYFMNIFGINGRPVVTRAVATNTGGGVAGGGGCLYTLGLPAAKLKISTADVGVIGNSTINAPTCGIVDNGNLDAVGSVSVLAGSIGVSGDAGLPSGQPSSCTGFTAGTTGVCPVPTTGMAYSGDPFSGKYPVPAYGASRGPIKITAGSCSGTGCAPSGQTPVSCTAAGSTTVCAVPAGTYDDICIDNNQTVNFGAGLFVLTGANVCATKVSFKINALSTVCNSTNADCSGMVASQNAGVTFYLVGGNSVNVDGTAQVQLAAPNSGTYEGLLFYQDPSAPSGTTMSLSGNSNSLYQGAIYGPTLDLSFGGNTNFNNGAAYTVIVTNQMDTAGNAYVNLASNFSGLSNGGGPLAGLVKWATLVE